MNPQNYLFFFNLAIKDYLCSLMKERKHRTTCLATLTILMVGVLLFILNLTVGSVTIPWKECWQVLVGNGELTARTIILEYRLPQAITALFAGIGLSISGLLMQTLFRNPLADPSILGISSGASLGVAIVVLLTGHLSGMAVSAMPGWSTIGVTLAAFAGAFLVLLLILALSTRLKSMVSLILVGIMIAYIAGSITDVLKFFSQKEDVHTFVIWGFGSFSNVGKAQLIYLATTILTGSFLAFLLSKSLNLILLGDRYAENLGLNIRRASLFTILVSGFLMAVITAFCGPIAFIGLAVPHLARFTYHTSNHFVLTPATAVIGMDLALLCNLIARLPGFDGNLPINSVTALIGAPIVIYVIFHRQKVLSK